ncbi:unnamed protein product [Linum trigynum]|uniref:Uncharacterized protein n=1 Tax=Linum trigynum TaxID=586398 RepID=A0AAV2CVD8_9ROSI
MNTYRSINTTRNQSNVGAAQGNQTGRNGDPGKVTIKSGKNPENEQGNLVNGKDKKGKEEQKGELKKGKAATHSGKSNGTEAIPNKANLVAGPTQIWRMVGPKTKEASLASNSQPPNAAVLVEIGALMTESTT